MNTWSNSVDYTANSRGVLGVVEGANVPFPIQRIFWLSQVPAGEIRADHAHLTCEQFIICAQGYVNCKTEDTTGAVITTPLVAGSALYLPTLTWLRLTHFSNDAMVLVLASEPYNEDEYIRDYSKFLSIKKSV